MTAEEKQHLIQRTGMRLRFIREVRGLSRAKASLATDIHENKINYMENGTREVSFTTIYELCQFYRVNLDDVFHKTDEEFMKWLHELEAVCEVA